MQRCKKASDARKLNKAKAAKKPNSVAAPKLKSIDKSKKNRQTTDDFAVNKRYLDFVEERREKSARRFDHVDFVCFHCFNISFVFL